jgi:hypothetical protein
VQISHHGINKQLQKGMSIGKFLEKVQQEFKELSRVSVENLMFVKEDLIIPHVCTPITQITLSKSQQNNIFSIDWLHLLIVDLPSI